MDTETLFNTLGTIIRECRQRRDEAYDAGRHDHGGDWGWLAEELESAYDAVDHLRH